MIRKIIRNWDFGPVFSLNIWETHTLDLYFHIIFNECLSQKFKSFEETATMILNVPLPHWWYKCFRLVRLVRCAYPSRQGLECQILGANFEYKGQFTSCADSYVYFGQSRFIDSVDMKACIHAILKPIFSFYLVWPGRCIILNPQSIEDDSSDRGRGKRKRKPRSFFRVSRVALCEWPDNKYCLVAIYYLKHLFSCCRMTFTHHRDLRKRSAGIG